MNINKLILAILFGVIFCANDSSDNHSIHLDYESHVDIAGFQFSHNGCVDNVFGGDAKESGFQISASNSVFLAFSFEGKVIKAGSGTLVNFDGDINTECLSGIIFSDSKGKKLNVSFATNDRSNGCEEDVDVCLSLSTEHHEQHSIPFTLYYAIPFIGILLSIAVIPLVNHHFWENNFGKISFFWALAFIIPFYLLVNSFHLVTESLLHTLFFEYIPFIVLLLALFTVSGGICLKGKLVGTPRLNLIILGIGTALASWMGTTGAAMLLIRPLLRANKWRANKVHTVVFFIFLVANIGGALTPLGDPPLFLGFLKGVDFFWTTTNLFLPMIYVSIVLLILYYFIDSYYYKKEEKIPEEETDLKSIEILGKINFIFLALVIGAVLMSGFWNPNYSIPIYGHVTVELQNILRDILLLVITFLSIKFTEASIRNQNGFTWFPIVEVAKLFIGIFITITPVLAILKVPDVGALQWIKDLCSSELMYFWITGLLSAFLDNAPTYLVFFDVAGGDAATLMVEPLRLTLLAISSGAVFLGAMTYIGNAPNFMVRAIAEENGVKMPSFFGFMAWSFSILGLTFISYSLIFLF